MSDHERSREGALDRRLRDEGAQVRALRTGCPPPDLLLARRADALTPGAWRQLDAHVAACEACRRLADDLHRLDLGTADAQIEARVLDRVHAGPARRRLAVLLPIAAALAVACGLAVHSLMDPTTPAGTASAEAVPPAPPAVAPGAEPHAVLWAISAPPLRVPLASLDPTRGAPSSGPAPSFAAAVGPYQAGDYDRASERFAEIVSTSPSSGDAQFYLGVSRLLAGHPGDAIPALTAARTLVPATRTREVDWYLAAALQRTGDHAGARARLDALCGHDGPYRAEACAAGTRLR